MSVICANLFFLFLAAPVLSPAISGVTVYLYFFVILLDIDFLKYIVKKQFPTAICVSTIILIAWLFVADAKAAVEAIGMIVAVQYALYSIECGRFYLMRYINISIAFAIVQMYLTVFLPSYKEVLGPTAISHAIWGSLATVTNTNFYVADFSFMPRVSGLSREGGFFSSLLCAAALLYVGRLGAKPNKWQMVFLLVGLFLSFSKITAAIVFILILWPFRRFIDRIPFAAAFAGVFLVTTLAALELKHLGALGQISVLHRFNGYLLPFQIGGFDLLFGMKFQYFLSHYYYLPYTEYYPILESNACGVAFPVIYGGLVLTCLFVFLFQFMGLKSFPFVCFFLVTFDVTPVTLDSMVVVCWTYLFLASRKHPVDRDAWQSAGPSFAALHTSVRTVEA